MSCTYCYKGSALPGEPTGTMVGQDYFTAAPNDAALMPPSELGNEGNRPPHRYTRPSFTECEDCRGPPR